MKKVLLTLLPLVLCLNVVSFASSDQTVTITTTGQGESLQQATDNALRSAIEQTFGTFISTRTEILNDELVSDQIASVASGNIQSYVVLAQTQLSETLWGVTLSAVVSVTKLTSFVQARGVQVEIQGGLFAANIRQQVLNEEAEIEAIRNMVGVLHEILQTAFDYSIEAGNPVATDATSSNWEIPLTITATSNDNIVIAAKYFRSTMGALSLNQDEFETYKTLNKPVYVVNTTLPIAASGEDAEYIDNYKEHITTQLDSMMREMGLKQDEIETYINQQKFEFSESYALRREQSFDYVMYLYGQMENYIRLYAVDTGLDEITSGGRITNVHTFLRNRDSKKDNKLIFLDTGKQVAIFSYNDKRSLSQIQQLKGYAVKPIGVISRVLGGDVYNPVTGKTWMDRNLGALWPAIGPDDRSAYGDYYTHEEARASCPQGYRLPTGDEWIAERNSWSSNGSAGAFASTLILLPVGRTFQEGSRVLIGRFPRKYWSGSTVSDGWAVGLHFYNGTDAKIDDFSIEHGLSVRCIKD